MLIQDFMMIEFCVPNLELLKNQLDITHVPFSDRGSRLMIFQEPGRSALCIKLAERLTRLQPDQLAYRQRAPFIRGLTFLDELGALLNFNLETSPHALVMHTRLGDFGVVFRSVRTLTFGIPAGATAGIRFHVSPQYWETSPSGGAFRSVRNLVYATNGEALRNSITPEEGGYRVEFIVKACEDCSINLTIGEESAVMDEVLPFSRCLEEARSRWSKWFERAPAVEARFCRTYTYAWWIMANNLISPQGNVVYEAMTPSKMQYIGLWLWDSAMHALAYRHVDAILARNQIRAMLACQLEDGMIPDAVYDEGIISQIDHPIEAEVTKPPILAWAALKLHEADPDPEFLKEIYLPLVRWNAWWFSMNDDDVDGLCQYNHPYSSGLDDNPLWDYEMPVESPDLNTYLCVQMGSLAVIAEELGLVAEGAMWRRRAASLVRRMIEDMWDPEAGLFWALHDEEPIRVVTPFNLYPLWTGQLPDPIRITLLERLTDPTLFWGDYVIPTVARSDPHYDPQTMWRGPVWANINYFFIEALRQIGDHQLADELQQKTLALINSHASIYEYYNSETGEPPASAADIFGWTAAVFIDLAIQSARFTQEAAQATAQEEETE